MYIIIYIYIYTLFEFIYIGVRCFMFIVAEVLSLLSNLSRHERIELQKFKLKKYQGFSFNIIFILMIAELWAWREHQNTIRSSWEGQTTIKMMKDQL